MTPDPPNNTPPAAPADPPKQDPPAAPPKNNLLDLLEADYVTKLKDKIELADYKEFDQETRIKIFRNLDKTLTKIPEPPKDKPKEEPLKKGDPVDPAAPPIGGKAKPIPTLLERNNMKDYLSDVRQKSSILNITNQLRGKK